MLKIGIPVMLHKEQEIQAYLIAKRRIEQLMSSIGEPVEVGVFAFYTRNAASEQSREVQINNQSKYQLEIIHAQLPLQLENSLTCDDEERKQFGKESILEKTIDHVAQLRTYGKQQTCSIDLHVGAVVLENINEQPGPAHYSEEQFQKNKQQLLNKAKTNFAQLQKQCNTYDMQLLLENEPVASMEVCSAYADCRPLMRYFPFSDIQSMKTIANDNITFDIAHHASTLHAKDAFNRNKKSPTTLFNTLGVASWEELARQQPKDEYLHYAKALHLSNVTGMGHSLEAYPELERQWGSWGETKGLVSHQDLRQGIAIARKQNIPVILEVNYDLRNIPVNKFSEADAFLNSIYQAR